MTAEPTTVGIAGAGSVAFATAALLGRNGHHPMLWSPSGERTALLAKGGALTANKAIEGKFHPAVAQHAQQLVEANSVVLIAVPGYGHKAVMDAIAPWLRSDQTVIISSHASLGALYLAGLLRKRGVTTQIVAWGTTVVTGRQQSYTSVLVNTVRKQIDMCTLPSTAEESGLALCRDLFGDIFIQRDGLLAISLSNLNPQNHMGIALGNMSRMERGEQWSQGQNVTPKIGALLEALDLERLAIADALGLGVKTIFEHFHLSFHVPVGSVAEMNQCMHECGNGGIGPNTADSRYVTEDVPYGLVLTATLGDLVQRPATLHKAGIVLFSAMYGRYFATENNLLDALRLNQYSLAQLQTAAFSGILSNHTSEG